MIEQTTGRRLTLDQACAPGGKLISTCRMGLGPGAALRTFGFSGPLPLHTKNKEYSGWGSSWATRARPIAMIRATMPSMRSVLLSLAGLRMPASF
jgi:hypothetical protein